MKAQNLRAFTCDLVERFPDARFDLARPATSSNDAEQRLDAMVESYVNAIGGRADVNAQEKYMRFTDELATRLGTEPSVIRKEVEIGLFAGAGLLKRGVAHLASNGHMATHLAQSATHSDALGHAHETLVHSTDMVAHGTDVATHTSDVAMHAADLATHGLDIAEGVATLGLSIVLSLGVGYVFRRINKAKQSEIDSLSQTALLKARLAKALMTPGKTSTSAQVIARLGMPYGKTEGA